MTEVTPEMRLRYLEEKQARRGLTDEEDVEMMELYVALGYLERGGLDPVTGEQQYLPIRTDEHPITSSARTPQIVLLVSLALARSRTLLRKAFGRS